MFYIQKRRPHVGKRDLALTPVVPALVVFAAFAGLTIWGAVEARSVVRENLARIRDRNIVQMELAIQDRLRTYEDILRAGTVMFDVSASVSRSEWQRFVSEFELKERYPGIQGVGYAERVDSEDLATHQDAVRADDLPGYAVRPHGERPLYMPIVYIEPMDEQNAKALGFDMYSERVRHEAMELARASGDTTITDTVTLVQEDNNPAGRQPGFLMYSPFYYAGLLLDTAGQRRAAHRGYVYAPFRAHDLLGQIKSADEQHFSFKIYAGDIKPETLLYAEDSYEHVAANDLVGSASHRFRVYNREWTVVGVVDPEIISSLERTRPMNLLWSGALFSVFVAGFLYLLLLNRSRNIAQREQREIQEAKDELLALASHQLRTPATGVKQYIGLLRDGYGGELTQEQQEFVEKAYASNERQLATINEMLLVARADAGNFKTIPSRFDIVTMVDEILEEQASVIRGRDQELRITAPKQKVFVHADERYIRMALENLISNATKYTPEGGKIGVRIIRRGSQVSVGVEDSGVGVPEKDRKMLFQKFSRIPNELTNKVSGSGIGLYLAKKIVEFHEGTVAFEPRKGGGSVFTVTLPIRENPEEM